MKCLAFGSVALLLGCANSVPMDNPSAPGMIRPATEQGIEARELEKAEAGCAAQGKHAVVKRVEGDTVYECVTAD